MRRIGSIIALTLCVLAFMPLPVQADSSAAPFDWSNSYRDYASNQFALEMPFTEQNFSSLQNNLKRYRYLILYFPDQSTAADTAQIFRIGFFASKQQAQAFQRATKKIYRQQRVIKISAQEHQAVISQLNASKHDGTQSAATKQGPAVFPIESGDKRALRQSYQTLLNRAKTLYINKDYAAAARFYLLLAALADHDTAAWASELAGLCYEKLGRRDLAMKQYRDLLQRFPDSRGVPRVTQRLRGLETAAADDPAALKSASKQNQRQFFTRGMFGQYYRTVRRKVNGAGSDEVLSLLSTDWDLRSSLHMQQHDINLRINGYQLTDNLESDNNELRLKRLFIDYRHLGTGIGGILGRQKDSNTGVFTSFDGITLSYPAKENLRVAVSTGAPVYTNDIYDGLDYKFTSIHSRWDFSEHWLFGAYLVKQTLNGLTDREAIGLRGRYNNRRLMGSLNMDYDTAFSELNNLLLNVLYRFTDNTDITALYGRQRSPLLSASNIFIGQANLDLEAYLKIKENKNSLLDDAFARTALNDYYSLSVNTRINDDVRWIVDYYNSSLTDVPSSEFLLGLPETGTSPDTFKYQSLGTQFIFENFFAEYDSATLGVRHTNSDSSDSNQIYILERLRLASKWTIVPKLMYSQITFDSNDDTQHQTRYSINLSYRPWRYIEFNLEAGNETIDSSNTDTKFESQYIFVGYRMNF